MLDIHSCFPKVCFFKARFYPFTLLQHYGWYCDVCRTPLSRLMASDTRIQQYPDKWLPQRRRPFMTPMLNTLQYLVLLRNSSLKLKQATSQSPCHACRSEIGKQLCVVLLSVLKLLTAATTVIFLRFF